MNGGERLAAGRIEYLLGGTLASHQFSIDQQFGVHCRYWL
jgi:hypothetical protein